MKYIKISKHDGSETPVTLEEIIDNTENAGYWEKGTVEKMLADSLEVQTPFAIYKALTIENAKKEILEYMNKFEKSAIKRRLSGEIKPSDTTEEVSSPLEYKSNLERFRKAKELSQSKLAQFSGVNVRMIQHYEQGVKDINKAQAITVYKLACALHCTVEDLLEFEDEDDTDY